MVGIERKTNHNRNGMPRLRHTRQKDRTILTSILLVSAICVFMTMMKLNSSGGVSDYQTTINSNNDRGGSGGRKGGRNNQWNDGHNQPPQKQTYHQQQKKHPFQFDQEENEFYNDDDNYGDDDVVGRPEFDDNVEVEDDDVNMDDDNADDAITRQHQKWDGPAIVKMQKDGDNDDDDDDDDDVNMDDDENADDGKLLRTRTNPENDDIYQEEDDDDELYRDDDDDNNATTDGAAATDNADVADDDDVALDDDDDEGEGDQEDVHDQNYDYDDDVSVDDDDDDVSIDDEGENDDNNRKVVVDDDVNYDDDDDDHNDNDETDDNGSEHVNDDQEEQQPSDDDHQAQMEQKSSKKKKTKKKIQNDTTASKRNLNDSNNQSKNSEHTLGGLNCSIHGGPNNIDSVQEMIYWRDIPTDAQYLSPFKQHYDRLGLTRYLTFEPDPGGWNNVRMMMETMVVLAHAMGRTLVMPPAQQMYLLNKGKKGQKTDFSFGDFFHLDSVDAEHIGIDIISTKEFLQREAITGHLRRKPSGKVAYPPNNRTDYDGSEPEQRFELLTYLRSISHVADWKPDDCIATIPSSPDPHNVEKLEQMRRDILQHGIKPYTEGDNVKPIPVDASPHDRLYEFMSTGRQKLCIYDQPMQAAPVVHFATAFGEDTRMLVPFNAMLFFEDWTQDLWSKRFVRDHLRYLDELQCAAARIVEAIRERARNNPRLQPKSKSKTKTTNPKGEFDSFHIRRGDFQYKEDTRISAEDIYQNSRNELQDGSTIYIATDERDKTFFDPSFTDHYDVCYLDDFKHLIEGLNTNYYGMLDQLVASKGRVFFGCYLSTFTGFITRMRGYHDGRKFIMMNSDNEHDEYDGTTLSYYYIPKYTKHFLRQYSPPHDPLWAREFPSAWRNIDFNVPMKKEKTKEKTKKKREEKISSQKQ